MTVPNAPEVWLRGSVEGVADQLQPVAHALLQVLEDVDRVAAPLTEALLWCEPGGAASVGFHLRHIAGSVDRLFTYARGEPLNEAQRATLAAEKQAGVPRPTAAELISLVRAIVERALHQLRCTELTGLHTPREVGRARLPSTVLGLLFHAAEHAQRHTGQIIATAKITQGLRLGS